MADDDILIVELGGADPGDGAAPYVQFKAQEVDRVRCEVSSNTYLDPTYQLDEGTELVLTGLGWSAPMYSQGEEPDSGSDNFHLVLERSYADRLAAMTVRAFRDVWSVPHPAFLTADALGDTPQPDLGVAAQTEVEQIPIEEVVYPEDADDLQRLVDETLTPLFGHPPEKDDDGDIPVRSGSALMFVRVRHETPVVEVFAPLVRDISDRTRAAEVVADLNRGSLFIRYVLFDDTVMAVISLPAMPFVPAHVRDMLSVLSDTAGNIDDEVATRLGGRLMFEEPAALERDIYVVDEETPKDLPPELLTLLHLDADGTGAVDDATAATVCGHDRDRILLFLKLSSEQEIEWRKSAETAAAAGDAVEAAACNHEAAGWQQTLETLRGALRLVVTANPPERSSRGG